MRRGVLRSECAGSASVLAALPPHYDIEKTHAEGGPDGGGGGRRWTQQAQAPPIRDAAQKRDASYCAM
jgi:hypothetical protein